MAGMPGIAARVFSALASQEINVVAIAQGSSELNISLVVASAQAAQAQKRIHSAFRLARLP
jgi:aspartokinase